MEVQPRILFYLPDVDSHSLKRYLAIAQQLAQDLPDVKQKIVTNSFFKEPLPRDVEVVIMPKLEQAVGESKIKFAKKNRQKREEYILNQIFHFHPDLVLVDRGISGVNDEILPALHFLKAWSPQTKIVYGMPDFANASSPPVSRRLIDINHVLDQFYDRILFYGQRELFDPIMVYQMPVSTAVKVVECGCLTAFNGIQLASQTIASMVTG